MWATTAASSGMPSASLSSSCAITFATWSHLARLAAVDHDAAVTQMVTSKTLVHAPQ